MPFLAGFTATAAQKGVTCPSFRINRFLLRFAMPKSRPYNRLSRAPSPPFYNPHSSVRKLKPKSARRSSRRPVLLSSDVEDSDSDEDTLKEAAFKTQKHLVDVYTCPITHELPEDPVIAEVSTCGITM